MGVGVLNVITLVIVTWCHSKDAQSHSFYHTIHYQSKSWLIYLIFQIITNSTMDDLCMCFHGTQNWATCQVLFFRPCHGCLFEMSSTKPVSKEFEDLISKCWSLIMRWRKVWAKFVTMNIPLSMKMVLVTLAMSLDYLWSVRLRVALLQHNQSQLDWWEFITEEWVIT